MIASIPIVELVDGDVVFNPEAIVSPLISVVVAVLVASATISLILAGVSWIINITTGMSVVGQIRRAHYGFNATREFIQEQDELERRRRIAHRRAIRRRVDRMF